MTKRKLKNMVQVLLESNIELMGNIESYKKMVKEANIRSSQLLEELKYAKRNEPIFTSDRYELKSLREKVQKAEEEVAYYKALSETCQESNEELQTEINRLVAEKTRKSDKQKPKANNS